jgi:hypothetical protein
VSAGLDDLKQTVDTLQKTVGQLQRLALYAARREWRDLLTAIPDPRRLEHFGRKVYSQNDEDGILEEIFRRLGLGPADGIFIECGSGNGVENNTHYLLRKGYSGAWIEGSEHWVEKTRHTFRAYVDEGRLEIRQLFITTDVIDATLGAIANGRNVSLLSIDVDGNDYWIWDAVQSISPAVVMSEYNARCPPPLAQVQKYRPDHKWDGKDYFGATLGALDKLAARKGYRLVGCNITGMNAFFVRNDLIQDRFPYELTATHLYQPPRYELTYDCFSKVGHKPQAGVYVNV